MLQWKSFKDEELNAVETMETSHKCGKHMVKKKEMLMNMRSNSDNYENLNENLVFSSIPTQIAATVNVHSCQSLVSRGQGQSPVHSACSKGDLNVT